MERYLKNLIEQFKQATGTKNVDINSQEFISELSEWIKSRKHLGKNYASFIEYGDNPFEAVNTQYIRRFLTHNPYDQVCIRNWEQLHNAGENITVGVFGSIYDKDIEQKIRQLKALRDKMTDGYFKEDYVTSEDSYCYAVSSARKVKVLEKELTR